MAYIENITVLCYNIYVLTPQKGLKLNLADPRVRSLYTLGVAMQFASFFITLVMAVFTVKMIEQRVTLKPLRNPDNTADIL